MNFFERKLVRLVYGRLEGKVPAVKKYAPLVGGAVLVAVVALRLLGYPELALALESLGGAVGLNAQSPVGLGELAAAGALLAGIVRKVRSEVRKARG